MKKIILSVLFLALISIFIIYNIEEAKSQSSAACSGTTTFPYSGTGSVSSSTTPPPTPNTPITQHMTTLYNTAMTQCTTSLQASLQAANAQCANFCLTQSTSQTLCLPKPKAPKTQCTVPNMQSACQFSTNPISISCTVSDSDTLHCSCTTHEKVKTAAD